MAYYNYDNNYNQRGFMGWLNSLPSVTKNILIVNVISFIGFLINEEMMLRLFALFVPTSPFFHIWQPVTYMFVHGGMWHILFNMYTLVMFGSVLERSIGTNKFLIFYFVSGLGAAATHILVSYLIGSPHMLVTPTVGASGAIYGILIGFAMFYPESRLTLLFPPVTLTAKVFVWIFVGIELFTGVTGTIDGVAHFAHLGGMLFGYLLLLYWRKTHQIWR